ncbi:MAG TPA: DUF308 domain-containing protein [Bacteroidales bacterium]|nr:DUF308 domain-containing protein [Bacteroidales bacterium]HPS63655.1 DUF308 domain-containing protein [Bacteroidales bacterium]
METPADNKRTGNRWFLVINGVILALYGLFILFYREERMNSLLAYSGWLVLAGGAVLLVLGINRIRRDRSGALWILEALAALAAGLMVLLFPANTAFVFVIVTGVWCLALGVTELVLIVNNPGRRSLRNLFLLVALLTLGVGAALLFNPFAWPLIFLQFAGVAALLCGVALAVFPVAMLGPGTNK